MCCRALEAWQHDSVVEDGLGEEDDVAGELGDAWGFGEGGVAFVGVVITHNNHI